MHISVLYQLFQEHPIICTDSRKVLAGSIFFALKGANFDGNKYAEKALESGAAYAVVDNADYVKNERYILVDDGLKALQQLALYHRRQFDTPFVGITGSNGKTTTKELVGAVLATTYDTIYTRGNFNNHIGVPLTLLTIPPDAEMAVIEMGANHQGEIAELCTIAEPTVGIITNVGKAHLEGFGGLDGVKKGKSELYQFLADNNGTALVNLDQNDLLDLALAREVERIVTYGQDDRADYQTDLLTIDPYVSVKATDEEGNNIIINSKLIGQYNYHNINTAIAVGLYFNISLKKIKEAIEGYVPTNNRSQIIHQGDTAFILDAYNANPTSTRHALLNFGQMDKSKKIAILGDMLELGEESYSEHLTIANLAKSLPIDKVILVGSEYRKVLSEVDAIHFDTVEAAKDWFEMENIDDTAILIKGSRGIKLEKLLKKNEPPTEAYDSEPVVFFKNKKINYQVDGSGFPIVLVHGFGEDQAVWDEFKYPFTYHHQVVTLDLPGVGLSETVEELSIDDMAEVVNLVLEKLNIDQCIMIGHSMGGYATLAFAEKYEYKLRGYGLFHSHPYADSDEKKANRQRGIAFVAEHGTAPFVKQMIPNLFAPDFVKDHPALIQALITKASSYDPKGIMAGTAAMKNRIDRSHVLKNSTVPVLFIIGKQDKAVSWEQSTEQTTLAEQSTVHILDIGHMGMFEAAEDTQAMIYEFVQYCLKR